MPPFGLYVHVPFCAGKCPYCDFYSLPITEELASAYEKRTLELAEEYGRGQTAGTVYFGGGTPSLLGAGRLGALLEGISRQFMVPSDAEITVEANPAGLSRAFFQELRSAGFNRLSLGLQSARREELRLLGRRHSPEDVSRAVEAARAAGFQNISLDLMLALPDSTLETLEESISFAAGLGPEHISAYLLKIEPGTPFSRRNLALPDDDAAADQYLYLVQRLEELGYFQYEISNFSHPGRESRHNLVYWRGEEYLGLGPGAHSFYKGRRFYWERDLQGYLQGAPPVDDGPGGSMEEFAMLNLRLTRGLRREDCLSRFGDAGGAYFEELSGKAARWEQIRVTEDAVSFTPSGFLVSNALLGKILF